METSKSDHVIVDGVKGRGQYVGTSMIWGSHNNDWWGEGEIRFFLDDDTQFPSICGTGTEDYFCGTYGFEIPGTNRYQEFSTAYSSMPPATKTDGVLQSQQRFNLYRWHILDPIRFQKNLKVTIESLDWHQREEDTYICRMTSLPLPIGIRQNLMLSFRHFPTGMVLN